MKNKEKLVTLMELGLTKNQARTYLALLQAGPTTAKELAKISKIARPDVYRVIPTLQKEGMVQKIITKPTMFEAIPAIDALPFLLNHKISKQNELKKKTAELIIDLKHNHAKKEAQVANTEFTIISGREAIVHKLKSSILKAQISVSAVTSKKRLSAAILEFAETYTKALEKNVKIRIAAERHDVKITALTIIQNLSKDPNFQVKYFPDAPAAIVAIFDNKEALITMCPTAQLGGSPAIWSSNQSFVAVAENYFEDKWNGTTYANNPLNNALLLNQK